MNILYADQYCAEGCMSREILDIIAKKWSMLIIFHLSSGTKRHAQLLKSIGGISQKVLTAQLRVLERDGIIIRTIYPVIPPRVEYSLSPLGKTLTEVTENITKWSYTHAKDIHVAREKFDILK